MTLWKIDFASDADGEALWYALEAAGLQVLYSAAEEGVLSFVVAGTAGPQPPLDQLPTPPRLVAPYSLPEIDWAEQWRLHAPGYGDDALTVDLGRYGAARPLPVLTLLPGAGFGDLSHPTTQMTLALLCRCRAGGPFFDIGCGSGLLALAAARLGYAPVVALDIDPAALEHCRLNARHNAMEGLIQVGYADSPFSIGTGTATAALNMITSEQEAAWRSLRRYHRDIDTLLLAGVLQEERDALTARWRRRGYHSIDETSSGPWCAFMMMRN